MPLGITVTRYTNGTGFCNQTLHTQIARGVPALDTRSHSEGARKLRQEDSSSKFQSTPIIADRKSLRGVRRRMQSSTPDSRQDLLFVWLKRRNCLPDLVPHR